MNFINDNIFSISSSCYPSGNSNLDYFSLDLFFIGCSKHCNGCHNKELWGFKEPNRSYSDLLHILNKSDIAKVVTLLGGDPIDSMGETLTYELINWIKSNSDKKVCIYTYREFNEIPKKILDCIDYLKTGYYAKDYKTNVGSFLSTSNQVMWKKINNSWIIQWRYKNNTDNNKCSW